ncbi:hypothetical protein TNCV_3183721 [Trichonephila clavipes]|nr:hypothetical protein TNCV_3183721 [Trichonephila clavipes]
MDMETGKEKEGWCIRLMLPDTPRSSPAGTKMEGTKIGGKSEEYRYEQSNFSMSKSSPLVASIEVLFPNTLATILKQVQNIHDASISIKTLTSSLDSKCTLRSMALHQNADDTVWNGAGQELRIVTCIL